MADYKKSAPFYHTAAWKKVRAVALMRDAGMCQDCMDRMRAGYGIKPRRATMVHHIVPIDERPDLALDLSNLRALCDECHNREHPEKWKTNRKQEDGPAPRMRVVKV
jgi:5-methylcytosine-specific restriction endonuclease McrA